MPPRGASGGNQERSRAKGDIIKLPDNYNFVELFPQLKILLAQQRLEACQTLTHRKEKTGYENTDFYQSMV